MTGTQRKRFGYRRKKRSLDAGCGKPLAETALAGFRKGSNMKQPTGLQTVDQLGGRVRRSTC